MIKTISFSVEERSDKMKTHRKFVSPPPSVCVASSEDDEENNDENDDSEKNDNTLKEKPPLVHTASFFVTKEDKQKLRQEQDKCPPTPTHHKILRNQGRQYEII